MIKERKPYKFRINPFSHWTIDRLSAKPRHIALGWYPMKILKEVGRIKTTGYFEVHDAYMRGYCMSLRYVREYPPDTFRYPSSGYSVVATGHRVVLCNRELRRHFGKIPSYIYIRKFRKDEDHG